MLQINGYNNLPPCMVVHIHVFKSWAVWVYQRMRNMPMFCIFSCPVSNTVYAYATDTEHGQIPHTDKCQLPKVPHMQVSTSQYSIAEGRVIPGTTDICM